MVRPVILSDRSIRGELAAGRIVIDPFDDALVQPSSVDVRLDRLFRVFRNHTAGVIDVKLDLTGLTELIEIADDGVFMLHPGEFVLGSTLERVALPDDLVARIEGKALSTSTAIPTPDGWSTMGEVRVGDRVFSHSGAPVRVKDVSEVMLGRPCFEVVFSDGSTIVADAAHQWLTTSEDERRRLRGPSLRTTAEIASTLRHESDVNHHVEVAGAVQCASRELPADPYELGRRIGGGAPTSGESVDDDQFIPPDFLRGSKHQRWSLLEGLLDANGWSDGDRCEYTTVDEALSDQVYELVCSLGRRATVAKRPAIVDGIDHGPLYCVTFAPGHRCDRSRSIVDARVVPSVPVRCIEVDGPDGMFLAGRSFVPTHNSSLGRLGLLIHSTAGFVDAGWDGHITLELANVASLPITLYPGMKIGQLSFMPMTTPADQPYGSGAVGSKYQGQRGPTPSRYFQNFE